ncbi:AMP-dependent synthetase/ligase [Nocardia terrae]|uniref:AMP-dependent synthetase/ligase n=1 Tax=Nocardia terrae TaxID=2675851 RepID=UPI0012F8AAEB|nr:long-chain fatty acid--CoA ligase [Nocardia terrae]
MTTVSERKTPQADPLGLATIPAAFQATVTRVADRVALRTLGGESEVTWGQYGEEVRKHAAALYGFGVGSGNTVALMTRNVPTFHYLDTALTHLGAIPISIYNTLPAADIAWILDNAKVRLAIVEPESVEVMREVQRHYPELASIISISGEADCTVPLARLIKDAPAGFDFEATWRAVDPTSAATVSYTSGTTGHPKGVVLSHRAILGSLSALDEVMGTVDGGRTVSFLPMAHVAERMFSHYRGIRFGLTVTTCPDPRLIAQHLADSHPHYVFSPPRLFEKLRAAIEAQIERNADSNGPAQREAIDLGLRVVDAQQAGGPVPDDLAEQYAQAKRDVLNPLLAALGLDQVVVALTGSAPVPPGLVRYFLALGVNALEAWGMSECTAFGSINRLDDIQLGTVGRALPGLELELLDDGEIILRSPWLMTEYLNRPELTAETIDARGWLHTGDIGEYDPDGRLKIIDRKKELIISAFGKNMSPANIEAKIKEADPIIGSVIAVGDARPYNVALIVIDAEVASALSGNVGDTETLSTHPRVRAAVESAVVAANGRLSRVEQIKKFSVLPDEWLPGGDELSPTMKLKRKPILQKYSDVIEALYGTDACGRGQ